MLLRGVNKVGCHRMARPVLGTLVEIRIDHPDLTIARTALEEGFREVYRIQDLMSVYDERSEVFGLNRKGFYENACPETLEVVKKGIYYSELTEGAFNIAILPVLNLWEGAARSGVAPTDSEIGKAMQLTNWRDISIKGKNIRLRKDGMALTLGGVAKGYAIDRAVDAIKKLGVKRAMVNGGGDIRVVGGNGNGAWRVGVRSPNKERRLITVVELADQAIATSGTDRRPLDDIINSESGTPAKRVKSSTVVAEHAVDADVLATAVYVLGAGKGMRLIESLKGVEGLIVNNNGEAITSSGFMNVTTNMEV